MKSNLSVEQTLKYNFKEASNVIAINNLRGEDWRDFENQMLARQKLFTGRAKNLTAHIFLSPSITDSRKLTLLDWKAIAGRFLEKARLTEYQSIVFFHEDVDHFHIHIVVNRIDKNGVIYRDRNELAMSQRIGDEIARERGLTRASVIRNERLLNQSKLPNGTLGSVAKMNVDLLEAAHRALDNEKKFVPEKYFELLKSSGYKIKLFFKKAPDGTLTAEINGYAIGGKGMRLIKASSMVSDFTLRKLKEKKFLIIGDVHTTRSIKIQVAGMLRQCISDLNQTQKKFDSQRYFEMIRTKGFAVKEYFNDTGKLRGYGVEKDGVLINASEVGLDFTLKNLTKQVESVRNPNEQSLVFYRDTLKSSQSKPDEQDVSKEFIRAVDMITIESEIKDLTRGHRYDSYDEFIKALEDKGYRVHLRYFEGQLNGYTIHAGAQHYHDHEIGNKEFSLKRLVENGVFKTRKKVNIEFQNPVAGTFKPSELENSVHEGNSIKLKPIANKATTSTQSEQIIISAEEREKVRKRIALELILHSEAIIIENRPFEPAQYFDRLKINGFELFHHFVKETKTLRGYSVRKYGLTFHSSEIGREFTLKTLQSVSIKTDNNIRPRMNF